MKRKLFMLVLSLIIISLCMILVYLDVIQDIVVLPVVYVFDVVAAVLYCLPQTIYLVALVVIGFVIAVFSILQLYKPASYSGKEKKKVRIWSQYQTWLNRCRGIENSAFSLDCLSIELGALLLRVLAYQENRTPAEVERMIIEKTICVPAAVRDLFVRKCLGASEAEDGINTRSSIWKRLIPLKTHTADETVHQQLERIITFLEN